ncbi:MAG: hypothetical protein ACP5F6_04565 [Microbacter sp.]
MKRHSFWGVMMFVALQVMISCTSSPSYEKPIWAYEQAMHADFPFQFYPDTFITVGEITATDSLQLLHQAINNHPIDSLIHQNEAALQNLSDLLDLDLKYDVESQREAVSEQMKQLQQINAWLHAMQRQEATLQKMPPQKPLVSIVECQFSFTNPITGIKQSEDKLYYIHLRDRQVIEAKNKHQTDTDISEQLH